MPNFNLHYNGRSEVAATIQASTNLEAARWAAHQLGYRNVTVFWYERPLDYVPPVAGSVTFAFSSKTTGEIRFYVDVIEVK